ncbi:MAG: RNA polymerase sigma factor [Rhodothermales bacterium]
MQNDTLLASQPHSAPLSKGEQQAGQTNAEGFQQPAKPVLSESSSVEGAALNEATVDETVLVEQARKGDRKAFRMLVERYQQSVALTVVSMLGRTSDVDDVVQEAFVRSYQTMDRFRGDASFATYVKKIAINKSLDVLRRRKRFLGRFLSRDDDAQLLSEPAADSRDAIVLNERAKMVHAAIDTLPPKHRAVVVLRMIEGYSTEETAQMLNLAYGTVLSRLSRAQKKLKDVLAPLIAPT